ncbi:MAG: hypothetical protein QNJ77_03350 [Acidimicrobiia bacterium]|nr:hypothetical protein [Acidimicrobiia bacterium]
MHNFTGKVHLANEPDAALDAKVLVDLNRILIRAGDAEIGSWQHNDVRIAKKQDGIHLATEGETLVLQLENGEFFLDLMGVNDDPPYGTKGKRRRKKPELMPEPPPGAPEGSRDKYVADEATSASFDGLRSKAAASYPDDTKLEPKLALILGGAAVLILLGAALNWGAARLFDPGSFPIARALAGFAGLTGLIGLYFAYFDRERLTGSALAISAGGVLLVILYFYTRAAQLKLGFVLALVGAVGLIYVGVIGMSEKGAAARSPEKDEEA